MTPPPAVAAFQAAARRLGEHPDDHGWRDLYRLFAHGLAAGRAPRLAELVTAAHARRPETSHVHLVTVLGIAVRSLAGPGTAAQLSGDGTVTRRLRALEELLAEHQPQLRQLLARRQNSFTAARRFLLPQILLGAYFAGHDRRAHLADLGTGLGLLPRQLNSRILFERYAPELHWPELRQPAFQPIPLGRRYGVDRGPLPDLSWVRSCYGPSRYYDRQFRELLDALAVPQVRTAAVDYHDVDITDTRALRRFVTDHQINTVILSYTLYQLGPEARTRVLDTLAAALAEPGLILVIEPNGGLTRPGCTVTVADRAQPQPCAVCTVSDGHFRGQVFPGAGYDQFVRNYPIRFESPPRAVDAAPRDHATG